jgi:agmatine deiminase
MLSDRVRLVICRTNDAWMRDIGPTFVVNNQGEIRGVDWRFNAWGGTLDGLYASWEYDDKVASFVSRLEHSRCYHLKQFVLEGGSFHVDGEGTCIVTEACLLSKGRNPQMFQDEITEMLKNYLNLEKVIWIPHGIYLDETNEHVDNICTYIKPGEVALAWCEDQSDPQYEFSKSSLQILENETDAKGRKLVVHKIVMPSPIYITEEESQGVEIVEGSIPRKAGNRQAGSYINYYVLNGAVIMPGFHDPMDTVAKEQIQTLYPDRKVIQVYSREVLLSGGNIHCITQQVPKKSQN